MRRPLPTWHWAKESFRGGPSEASLTPIPLSEPPFGASDDDPGGATVAAAAAALLAVPTTNECKHVKDGVEGMAKLVSEMHS